MKKLAIAILILVSVSATAQTSVYHPFPDSNATWCCTYLYSFPPDCYDGYSTYLLKGKQIINSHLYNRIVHYDSSAHILCQFWQFVSSILQTDTFYTRQDTALKTIWIYDSASNTDKVLYNFNLSVGDTLDTTKAYFATGFGGSKIITSIDSILINGTYRKRYNYNTGCTMSPTDTSMVEGIGALHGLMYPPSCFEEFFYLKAFSLSNILFYDDPHAICLDFTSGISEINNKTFISLFPNPFHTSTTLKLNSAYEKLELKIYNTFGEEVRRQQIISQTTTITRDGLRDGIYFFQVINSKGNLTSGKFVLE